MPRRAVERARGFTLVEVLIAMTLLVVGVSSIAHLSSVSARANVEARTTTMASMLAAQKVEQLHALAWTIDLAGQPVSDTSTDVTVFPPAPAGGVGLSPSPPDALTTNVDGYRDFVDATGRVVSAEAAVYVRRWSIAPLPDDPADTIVLQVLVTRYPARAAASPEAARLVAVRSRRPM